MDGRTDGRIESMLSAEFFLGICNLCRQNHKEMAETPAEERVCSNTSSLVSLPKKLPNVVSGTYKDG